jgi:hypothetical protein
MEYNCRRNYPKEEKVGKAESKSKAPKPLKSMKDSTGSPNGHH